ncbi:ECF transporter S component [Anaerocolumna sp. MB42-C2]|uniref:ECF transporter S component n=1 Tax=Anaerocolumna sp. MB42-C2 TaxID=3070997 RepID=UPI0027E20E96|nr:ECF transporter S component [Anaerocolumna sp. MB42-C2]WMJ89681.1 ECF transporter S component [Anaerocolumna sp. MB42-C2]
MNNKTLKLVVAALMAAMTCIATMIIKIPSPTSGYIHMGDGFVLLSGIILGPVYGGLAAGIGSMFADLFSGYAGYAPATFIIKALAAVVGGVAFYLITSVTPKIWLKMISVIIAGILGGIVVTGGYFIFEAHIMGLGFAAALTGVPFNLLQNVFGIIVSFLLFPVLYSIQNLKGFNTKVNKSI